MLPCGLDRRETADRCTECYFQNRVVVYEINEKQTLMQGASLDTPFQIQLLGTGFMIDSQRFIARKVKIIVLLNVMVETIVEVEMSVVEITYVIESLCRVMSTAVQQTDNNIGRNAITSNFLLKHLGLMIADCCLRLGYNDVSGNAARQVLTVNPSVFSRPQVLRKVSEFFSENHV